MSHNGSGSGADGSGLGGPKGHNFGASGDNRNYYSSRYNNSFKNGDSSSYNGRRNDQQPPRDIRDSRDYYGGYNRPSGGYRGRGRASGGAIYSSSASAASSATPSSSNYRKRPYDKYDSYSTSSSKFRKSKELSYKDLGSHYLGKYDKYEPDNERPYDSRRSLEKPDLVFSRKERTSDSYSSSFNDDRRKNDKSEKHYDHRGYKDDTRNFVASKTYSDDRRRPHSSSVLSFEDRRRPSGDSEREKSLSNHSSHPNSKQPSPMPQSLLGLSKNDELNVSKKKVGLEGDLRLERALHESSIGAETSRNVSLSETTTNNNSHKEEQADLMAEPKKEPQQKTSFAAYLNTKDHANRDQKESEKKLDEKNQLESATGGDAETNDHVEVKQPLENMEKTQKVEVSEQKKDVKEEAPEKPVLTRKSASQEIDEPTKLSQGFEIAEKTTPAVENENAKSISDRPNTATTESVSNKRDFPPAEVPDSRAESEHNVQIPTSSQEMSPVFAIPKAIDPPTVSHNDITPLSPIASNDMADSSVLSPIADKVTLNESFIKGLQGDRKECVLNNILDDEKLKDEDLSEAETVIINSPPRMTQGHKFARRRDRHDLKRKLKQRKLIFSSDEEEEEVQDSSRRESEEEGYGGESADDKRLSRTHSNTSNTEQTKKSNAPYKGKRDSTGRTLLQRACIKGDVSEVKRFLERGADANESDFGGYTCLHEAALAGHTEVVECLLQNGAAVNSQAQEAGFGETPLMDAAENKHVDTVKVLLNHGADPQIYNSDGYSALTKIYKLHGEDDGYEEIIKLLDKAIGRLGGPSGRGAAPLLPDKVIEDPNDEYFANLLKKKNITSTIYRYVAQGLKERAAEDFLAHNFTLQSKPDILILAARNGHIELVDILLGLNPGSYDINLTNKAGITALLAAVGKGNLEVIKFLLSKGADPNMRRETDGLNALEVAKYSAHYDPREVEILTQAILGEPDQKTDVQERPLKKETEKPAIWDLKNAEKDRERVQKDTRKDHDLDAKHDPMEIDSEDDIPSSKVIKRTTSSVSVEGGPSKKKAKGRGSEFSTPEPPSDFKKMKSTPTGSPVSGHERPKPHSPSPAPAPLTQAQIEQKQKAAEEARIWQEKVEAKKRARKESFLKNEKDKERKRKEEEEKKIEEKKRLEIMQREEKVKAVKAAEELQKKLDEEKALLVQKLTLQSYPIGLRNAKFGQKLTLFEMMQYTPLYVFDINQEDFVTDLQLALLTGVPVSKLYEKLPSKDALILSDSDKAKIWDVFYPMLGVSRSAPSANLREEGRKQFGNLLISYVKKSDAILLLESGGFSDAFRAVIEEKRVVKVDLVPAFEGPRGSVIYADDKSEVMVNVSAVERASFVPPRLRLRQDAMRAIQAAKMPLW